MLVDIITLIVGLVLMLLITALAWAVWWKIVDKTWAYLEDLLGKKITNCIALISFILIMILLITDIVVA